MKPGDSWAIVGGGMLGMYLAHALVKLGKRVTIFEAADQLGGLASAWRLEDVVWDRHYHVILYSDLRLRALLRELDLEKEIEWVQTRTGFYTDGQLFSLSSTIEFLAFPPLRMLDKLRLGATIFYASRVKNWRKLERITVEEWLTRWSGGQTFQKIWRPLLRAKLGDCYQKTSAAFIWATIARMYAARRSGLKKEMFGYVPGGYARILERFEKRLRERDVKLRLSTPIAKVERSGGRIHVVGANSESQFDRAVVTLPASLAPRVCRGLNEDEKGRLGGVQYLGIVCASLLLKRPLSPFYITNITDPWVPFTAVIEMSSLVDPVHFGGRALVYLPKYVLPDDPLFERRNEDLEEEFLSALDRMHPDFRREDVICFRVSRARHVFALSTLRYSETLPPVNSSVTGLHLVNSSQIVNGTLNVNETIQLAERALPEILSQGGPS